MGLAAAPLLSPSDGVSAASPLFELRLDLGCSTALDLTASGIRSLDMSRLCRYV